MKALRRPLQYTLCLSPLPHTTPQSAILRQNKKKAGSARPRRLSVCLNNQVKAALTMARRHRTRHGHEHCACQQQQQSTSLTDDQAKSPGHGAITEYAMAMGIRLSTQDMVIRTALAMALHQNTPWPWPRTCAPKRQQQSKWPFDGQSDPASAMAFHQNAPWPRARSKVTVGGSQESIVRPSPFGSVNMPALGVDARVHPSTAKKERKTPPRQSSKIEISPFLAYENLRHDAATSPDTWPRSPW